MSVKNVQISFDEDLLDTIDELAAALNLTRSAIVREALKNWVRQRGQKFRRRVDRQAEREASGAV
jgi:metal-responsive CopG/Arc/MetJ family transcriptional regulator